MTTVDAFSTGDQAVAYKPQFTPRGLQEAQAAVKAYFDNMCVKKTSSLADAATCPQGTRTYLPYSGSWQLIGDPTQGLTVGADKDGSLLVNGHYQMAFAYGEEGVAGTQHVPDGGVFNA